MKTASVVFGLVVATTGIASASPLSKTAARPRVDRHGDVACGNVDSKGGGDTCTMTSSPSTSSPTTTARTATTSSTSSPTTTPLTPPPGIQLARQFATQGALHLTRATMRVARPLVDADGDVATGNVMKKLKK
jgi:hypothetical protein